MSRNGMYLWCAVINIDIKLTSQVGHLMWTSFFRRFLTASVVGLECWLHRSIYGSIATPKKESNKWNSGRNLKKKAKLRWLIIRLHFFWGLENIVISLKFRYGRWGLGWWPDCRTTPSASRMASSWTRRLSGHWKCWIYRLVNYSLLLKIAIYKVRWFTN